MAPIAQSGLFGGQKCCFSAPPTAPRPAVRRSQDKKVVFFVFRHDGIKKFGWRLQKIDFGPKNWIFGPQTDHFGYIRPYNSPPSSRMGTYQKTKVIQSYLMMWASYDPIELGPSEPKNWGSMGVE